MSNTHTMVKTSIHAAPPETVWGFLTESEKMAQWFHEPTNNLANGEAFTMMSKETEGKKLCWGSVLEWDEPNKLVYSFALHVNEALETRVEWQLKAVPGGTKLTLTHSGLPADAEALGLACALDAGWDEHIGKMRAAIKG